MSPTRFSPAEVSRGIKDLLGLSQDWLCWPPTSRAFGRVLGLPRDEPGRCVICLPAVGNKSSSPVFQRFAVYKASCKTR